MGRLVLITGGARSGKSGYAQKRVEAYPGNLLYVATAEARDEEMAARVAQHRSERGARWSSLEEPLLLAERLPLAARGCAAVLLDCLTLWLSNLMEAHGANDAAIMAAVDALVTRLRDLDVDLYVVSNELGSGVVPENRLARRFRDLHGLLNQKFAQAADEAWLVVAGLPLKLKP
ncbi:MAG: bifunctional adenosylcobinamide kinase/adenosylcobinamide-phosphate guanylyltransferase [Desulfuromonadales bacterium]|nr:bifunctional adenosylcobinamide kinase/adenosylcobinamide-phosphate guanylyltransferase [Desulfuromonadales bacterium]